MKTILIMGSTSDEPHAKKITDKLDKYKICLLYTSPSPRD